MLPCLASFRCYFFIPPTLKHGNCQISMNPSKNKIFLFPYQKEFVYSMLFVVKIMENRQLSIYYELNTRKVNPHPRFHALTASVSKHADMSMDVSPKGVCLGNININLMINFFVSVCAGRGRGTALSQFFEISIFFLFVL